MSERFDLLSQAIYKESESYHFLHDILKGYRLLGSFDMTVMKGVYRIKKCEDGLYTQSGQPIH